MICCIDTETVPFGPDNMAPPLVCLTWQADGDAEPHIVSHIDAEPMLRAWLLDPNVTLAAHNASYDVAVCMARYPALTPLFYAAYDADRVTCTNVREKLLDNAMGRLTRDGYSLTACLQRYGRPALDKDTWRMRYAEFIDVPVSNWPEGARHYALEDARAHLTLYRLQEQRRRESGYDALACQWHEARSYLALGLSSNEGLHTDPPRVDLLETQVLDEIDKVKGDLVAAGFLRSDGTRDTKRVAAHMTAACAATRQQLVTTAGRVNKKTGQRVPGVAIGKKACKLVDDPLLKAYARLSSLKSLIAKDVVLLRSSPIHARFGYAETGRTTTSPNIQNFATEVK